MQYGPKIATNGLVLALDAADMNSYSPNVHPNSIDIYAWAINGGSTSCTITRDSSQTRQYGSKPMKMAVTGNDPYIITINYGPGASSIWNLAPAVNGQTWTISVYVKASVATTGELFLMPADSNGVVITSASGAINITTSWTRVSYTYTISSANCAYIQCRLDGPNTGGSGIDIWWDGLQVERASSATQFNPYYYGNTVWRDFSRNNNNGSLISGPIFTNNYKGGIVFDGVDDYATTGVLSTTITPTNNWTINVWCSLNSYPTVSGTYKEGILFGYAYYGGLGIYAIATSTGVVNVYGFFRSDTASTTIGPFTPWSTNVPTMFTLVHISGTGCRFLVNGVFVNSSSTTGGVWPNYMPSPFSLYFSQAGIYGSGSQTYINYPITAYSSNVYIRALSDSEILQNYRASKGKFGL